MFCLSCKKHTKDDNVIGKLTKNNRAYISAKCNICKDLDLLLIDEIKHYILSKNIKKFISDNSHVIKTCRNCLFRNKI